MIAAGFICTDGVLLASDTLYSNTGMGQKFGPKFWIINHGDLCVAFGGAGTEAGLLRARDEYIEPPLLDVANQGARYYRRGAKESQRQVTRRARVENQRTSSDTT